MSAAGNNNNNNYKGERVERDKKEIGSTGCKGNVKLSCHKETRRKKKQQN